MRRWACAAWVIAWVGGRSGRGAIDRSGSRARDPRGPRRAACGRIYAIPPSYAVDLAARVGAEVDLIGQGDPQAVERGLRRPGVILQRVDPILDAVLDHGNVDAGTALLAIDGAGWTAASTGLPTGPCLAERARRRDRAQRLASELQRASLQSQVLLLGEVDVSTLEWAASGARPGPRARIQARVDATQLAVAWAKELTAEIRATPGVRTCGSLRGPRRAALPAAGGGGRRGCASV